MPFVRIDLMKEGRAVKQRKAPYSAIVAGLAPSAGVRTQNVFIDLVEVRTENWSLGNGVGQYAA